MIIHDFDGTPIDYPEEGEIGVIPVKYGTPEYGFRGFDENDTCRFHMEKGGVACEKKRRQPDDCDRCGWNPKVAHRRSYMIRKKIYEADTEDAQKNATD